MFTLNIQTDGAAFQGSAGCDEVARILRHIATTVELSDGYDKFRTVFDLNGNDCGRWKIVLPKGEGL